MSGLVEAANAALHDMEDAANHRFVSARRLGNGGVLLEMDSEAAACWLSAPASQASFLSRFAPDALVRERAFSLVVQFVPLYFKPEKEMEICRIEEDNDLSTGSLLRARWIKPAYWRARDQNVAMSSSLPLLLRLPTRYSLTVSWSARNGYMPRSAKRSPPAA